MIINVTYIGDTSMPETARPITTFRGREFPLNAPVPIDTSTPDGLAVVERLKTNREFRVDAAGDAGGEVVKGKRSKSNVGADA